MSTIFEFIDTNKNIKELENRIKKLEEALKIQCNINDTTNKFMQKILGAIPQNIIADYSFCLHQNKIDRLE